MKLKFWGTRGGIATPSVHTEELGGNTTCLELGLDSGQTLLLDAGTGIIEYASSGIPKGHPHEFHILFTHFHWDHMQGFPFFFPIHFPDSQIYLYSPFPKEMLFQHLSDLFDGTYSPLKNINNLNSTLHYAQLAEGGQELLGAQIHFALTQHPEPCYAYRIEADGQSLCFVTDHEARDDARNQGLIELMRDVDLLVHDAQFTEAEYQQYYQGWGHSSIERAIQNAREAQAARLLLTHHDPVHSDDFLRTYLYRLQRHQALNQSLEWLDLASENKLYTCKST